MIKLLNNNSVDVQMKFSFNVAKLLGLYFLQHLKHKKILKPELTQNFANLKPESDPENPARLTTSALDTLG